MTYSAKNGLALHKWTNLHKWTDLAQMRRDTHEILCFLQNIRLFPSQRCWKYQEILQMLHSYSCFYFTRARKKVTLYSKSPFCVKIGSKFFLANLPMILPIRGGGHGHLVMHTANEGPVRIQYKWQIPISVFPEVKLCRLLISKTEFYCSVSYFLHPYICERFIYFQDRCRPILGICKSLIDTWMWKLGLRPRNSQKRNT